MKKGELKLQIQILKESNRCLSVEVESLKSMNLTGFYNTIAKGHEDKRLEKERWFKRMDSLIKDVVTLINELKQ